MSEVVRGAPTTHLLSDLVAEFVADAELAAQARATGQLRGPITGLAKLDEALGGYLAPGVHIVQAAPGAGKTALALQVAARCGFPALFVSAEMGPLEVFRRLIARETGTFLGRLKSGELNPQEAQRLALATVSKLPHFALMDGVCGYAAPEYMRDAAEGLRRRAEASQVLIVVDSLQVWARSARAMGAGLLQASEYDLINAGLQAIAALGTELGCPVWAVSHRNRVGNRSEGGLHAGKGSGDLEYVAETVLDLKREDTSARLTNDVLVSVTIHKNRHGIPGVSLPLSFSGRLQLFTET